MEVFWAIISPIWAIFKVWWWVLLPVILCPRFLFMWIKWRQDEYAKTVPNMLLELKMPAEVDRPFRAMEQVFAGFWMLYDPPDWWEHWWEGKYQVALSIEVVSIGGDIHFYIRTPEALRNLIESSIYAQYPEVEITEAEDYTLKIPQDIPNKTWDMWGCDYEFIKPDIYPMKTYSKFFEESPAAKEEKRIDPLAALLEGLAQVKPGEQIWVQIRIKPVTNAENNYKDRTRTEVNKLVYRNDDSKNKTKQYPLIKQALDVVLTGQPPADFTEEKKEGPILPPEMKLTPGEREIVSLIEQKISKVMFEGFIRFIILGEKDKWHKANLKNVLAFFANFNTENVNSFKPWSPSLTKIHKHGALFLNMLLHDRKLYMRKRKLFRRYQARLWYNYPKPDKTFILNLEELATMFHFVGRSAVPAPMVQRVEAKKAEPPINLPGT